MNEETLNNLMQFYGSDKSQSRYCEYYEPLFLPIKEKVASLLEIGIGTLDPTVPDSYSGIHSLNPHYIQGGSLRAWRDYFTNARIYGIDIADDCKFEEDRIETFIFSSLDFNKCQTYFKDSIFDIIIDDGSHMREDQLLTLANLFNNLKDNGIYAIEDTAGGKDTLNIFIDLYDEFLSIVGKHTFVNLGKIVFIYKDYSETGLLPKFEDFLNHVYNSKIVNEKKENIKIEPINEPITKSLNMKIRNKELTVVTGLWNINRTDRDFNHYIDHFKKFLQIPVNMFIYIQPEYEHLIWQYRKESNTYVKSVGIEYINEMFKPFSRRAEKLRNNPEWYEKTGSYGVLKDTPQGKYEQYNPIVLSKMPILNDVTIWNPFDSKYFIWMDAGITNSVDSSLLIEKRALDNINPCLEKCLFLTFPNHITDNIQGFDVEKMKEFAYQDIDHICRGGLFGGSKAYLNSANAVYYSTMDILLGNRCMGTDENVLTIISCREPEYFNKFKLDDDGSINKFLIELSNNTNPESDYMNEEESDIEHSIELMDETIKNNDLTIVTGLWNINRPGRDFSHYIENFRMFLKIPNKMFIYIPLEYEYLVWEIRNRENTVVKIFELEDIKQIYNPFWDRTQKIRLDPEWYNSTGEYGWLKGSPQAVLEYYNPIVQSKLFLLNDVTVMNPFNTEYFIWLDAGITNTINASMLINDRALDKINPYLKNFLFMSYPYEATDEIHGFNFKKINEFAAEKVTYVCRGGLFGGTKESINIANSTYYSTLDTTLNNGCMGTEESIFSIMAHREPHLYRRYELDGNGLIVKFIDALINDNVVLNKIDKKKISVLVTNNDISRLKTNLYILTFNFPEQLLYTIESMKKNPEWLTRPKLHLLDNSTIEESKVKNREIALDHNFEYIDLLKNTGICGGRQAAAEHFHQSDADFMFFFEDDMTINPPELEGQFCRNGFRKFVPNLYSLVHKIMLKEDFDFLKLSFTEVFFDNDKQCSWYNVPQAVRAKFWPDYDKLPISGLDPNVPLTNFKNIRVTEGLSYIDGEIYYANWPMIVSKKGNQKMFIDTKWSYPYEQTWMSYMFQMTKEDKLHPAILLASPIWHERIKYYKPEERREN